jgi:2-dehydropantoate 2-reductase
VFRPEASVASAAASLDALVVHNRRSAKTHSGIWRDLAVRKRKTEVDAQLGPIAEIGERHGRSTVLTQRLVALIHDVEEGRRPQGWTTLDALVGIAPTPKAASGSAA